MNDDPSVAVAEAVRLGRAGDRIWSHGGALGGRRFYVRDPLGKLVNILTHG